MKPSVQLPKLMSGSASLIAAALMACAAVFWSGCRIVSNTAKVPSRTVAVFFPGGKQNQPEPGDLQQGLMRIADTYNAETAQSVNELTAQSIAPFTPRNALEFKLASATAAIAVATRENPYAGLLDTVALTTLTRMALEHYQTTITNGKAFDLWVKRSIRVESNAWALADQVLAKNQQDQLRQSIKDHAARFTTGDPFPVEPIRMASALPRTLQPQKEGGELLDLSAIDPFAGLDPAVREVTETRLFAERAMYSLKRMPWLLRAQAELLVYDATAQPQVAKVLGDATELSESVNRASRAAEDISRTVEALPDQISAERKALVEAVKEQGGELTTLVTAATALSDSLSSTVTNTDALMKRFGVGEPKPPGEQPKPDPNAKPFDILDYAQTAEKATALARQLNSLASNLNVTMESPAMDKLSEQATSDVRGILNHAFLLAAGLVVLILVCSLVYRVMAKRTIR